MPFEQLSDGGVVSTRRLTPPRWIAGIALATIWVACGSHEKEDDDAPPVLAFTVATMRLVSGSDTLRLLTELASRPEQRTLGLMERRHLADTAAMLFVYPDQESDSAGFWMFRTRIPLDIAFMDSTGAIRAIQHMVPCPTEMAQGCPSYFPGVPYRHALEVNAGYFARHGVGIGARLLLADTARRVTASL